MTLHGVERIEHEGTLYAIVLRGSAGSDEKYNFLTGPESPLQLGMNFYSRGQKINAHYHLPRAVQATELQEFLLIGEGRAKMTLYSVEKHQAFSQVELGAGDMVLLTAGGHSFELLEDTKIVEIKQGPYDGKAKDKVVFG